MKTTVRIVACLCAAATALSASGCFKIDMRTPEGSLPQETYQDYFNQNNSSANIEYTTAYSQTQMPTQAPVYPDAATTQPAVTQPDVTQPVINRTPDTMSNSELYEYFNDCLNAVKVKKPGFTKEKLTQVLDLQLSNSSANSLVSLVKSALLSEETETTPVAKGADCTNVMSPSGQTYVSRINLGDLDSITCTKSGSDYVITANIVSQVNPEKASGVMSDLFDFVTVDDVLSTYAPKVDATVERGNVELIYKGCYAKLTVTADGRVREYETYVKCDMMMYDATIKKVVTIKTDVDVTLASTTKYTGFAY